MKYQGDKTDVTALVKYAQSLEQQLDKANEEIAALKHDLERHIEIAASALSDEQRCDCLPWPDKCPYCGGQPALTSATDDLGERRRTIQDMVDEAQRLKLP